MSKVVIITGARRGIGEATAYKFAQMGNDVVVNDKEDKSTLDGVVSKIKDEYGVDAIGIFSDISKEENVKNMLTEVIDKFGRVDALVNNAAIVSDLDLEERTEEIFNETILNNISSTYAMCKHVGGYMFENNEIGKIVNVSSTNGIDAFYPTSIDYDATKAAVISLTHNFAQAYAPKVLVNSVAPHWVNTDMNKELPPEFIKEECDKIYLNRFAEPSEVASLIYYLCSDENTYINSEVIKISGGY